MNEPIYVTRPYLPPLADFVGMLETIWDRRILTNNGPFLLQFERELEQFLDVGHVSVVTNGALALEVALRARALEGDVITTPYSFVATSHAIRLCGARPVFVDIDERSFNMDPSRIEAAITPRTSAIVAVHCYGTPCDVDSIQSIADRHGLSVIYDAAHAFATTINGRSVLSFGDYSTLSFHATKCFHTFEGGAVCSVDRAAVDLIRNFGIAGEESIPAIGTNAKMSELNAAMGLLQLRHFGVVKERRKMIHDCYLAALAGIEGLVLPGELDAVDRNYSYFPVRITDQFPISRDELTDRLKSENIFPRKYFFPLLSSLPMYRDEPSATAENLPVANRVAEHILCLPIYPDMTHDELQRVISAVLHQAEIS